MRTLLSIFLLLTSLGNISSQVDSTQFMLGGTYAVRFNPEYEVNHTTYKESKVKILPEVSYRFFENFYIGFNFLYQREKKTAHFVHPDPQGFEIRERFDQKSISQKTYGIFVQRHIALNRRKSVLLTPRLTYLRSHIYSNRNDQDILDNWFGHSDLRVHDMSITMDELKGSLNISAVILQRVAIQIELFSYTYDLNPARFNNYLPRGNEFVSTIDFDIIGDLSAFFLF